MLWHSLAFNLAISFVTAANGTELPQKQFLAFLRPATNEAVSSPSASEEKSENPSQARRVIDNVELYDKSNPDNEKLQRINTATRELPYDANGFPDWMRALNLGLITPRTGLHGSEKMEVLDLDIVMRNTKEMPYVRFPHRTHTLWLACTNCHPEPFETRAGAAKILMSDIFRGEYCGKCHDRVAFITFFSCSRCHSIPQATSTSTKKK
jgi:c(7)-type cytochrome triheme protein